MKLTDKSVAAVALPAGRSEAFFWDSDVPGFGLRVRGNSRTYVVQYKIGAKHRRMTLGVVTAMTAAAARDRARDIYARVRLGEDPAGAKSEARHKAGQTFGNAVRDFLDVKSRQLRPSSYADLRHGLQTHAKTLDGLQVEKITRADIAACLGAVEARTGSRTRNKVRAHLSSFFAWSIAEGRAENNPVLGTWRAAQKSRDRVLSPVELATIWQALPDSDFGAVMKLLALTGQRQAEISHLKWSEVSDDFIEFPPEITGDHRATKNHRHQRVPLSAEAKAIIASRPRRADARTGKLREYVFGHGRRGFSGWTRARAALNKRITETTGQPLPHWQPHDLRRSFVTHANEIGIAPHVVELLVNHVSGHRGGVAGIYNKATLDVEKRIAMQRWAEQLMAWVERRPAKVVPLLREQS